MFDPFFLQRGSEGNIFSKLKDAMNIIGNRDPEEAVREYLKNQGVTEDQLNDVMKQAQAFFNVNRGAQRGDNK